MDTDLVVVLHERLAAAGFRQDHGYEINVRYIPEGAIAYNCFIDHCRRRSVRPKLADEADAELSVPAPVSDAPDRNAENSQLGAQLRAAIGALPPEQRDAFLLYEESGLSVEQIAAVTGVGAETAKSRLRYAVAKLRAALAGLEPER